MILRADGRAGPPAYEQLVQPVRVPHAGRLNPLTCTAQCWWRLAADFTRDTQAVVVYQVTSIGAVLLRVLGTGNAVRGTWPLLTRNMPKSQAPNPCEKGR